jgi:hypothetical protein
MKTASVVYGFIARNLTSTSDIDKATLAQTISLLSRIPENNVVAYATAYTVTAVTFHAVRGAWPKVPPKDVADVMANETRYAIAHNVGVRQERVLSTASLGRRRTRQRVLLETMFDCTVTTIISGFSGTDASLVDAVTRETR